jgi:hypothetical protein
MFHLCPPLQHVPFLRGLCCDELPVLAVRDDAPPLGFALGTVQRFLEREKETAQGRAAAARLLEARKRGWLHEHLYLAIFVDELEAQAE